MRASKTKIISLTHPTLNFAHHTLESFTWNNIIRAHVQATTNPPTPYSPFFIYLRMLNHGVKPDSHTFPFLLHSFNTSDHLHSGSTIHTHCLLFGLSNDAFVQTSLINMYSSCGSLDYARKMFEEIPQPDLASWNSIVNACVKVGLVDDARKLFDEMPERNVISWSCMVNGYVRCGEYKEALALFREMQVIEVGGLRPNEFTLSSVLLACGRLGALEHGKWVHAYIDKCGMRIDVVLGTSLIDMYAKCGDIDRAKWVFYNIGSDRDVMAWSSMISSLAMHGHGEDALSLFGEMVKLGVVPNAVTFLGVLCACVHGGFVDEGKEYFRRMREEFEITPQIQHYGCMVDLYGRAGMIEEAWNVVNSMPLEPDVLIWGTLLSGSRIHEDIETCEVALKKLIQLEPTNSGAHVLLSNVYAKMGRWSEVRQIRDLMDASGVQKVPGVSLVEVDGILHEFFVGDDSHLEYREIVMMLDQVMKRLRLHGYVGKTSEVLLDLDEEGKELALYYHSEKLAAAYCLLKTKPGTEMRIIKNLRICTDCHTTMKMISKVFNRKIVVRDCNRFHHFGDGECSCRDYW